MRRKITAVLMQGAVLGKKVAERARRINTKDLKNNARRAQVNLKQLPATIRRKRRLKEVSPDETQ